MVAIKKTRTSLLIRHKIWLGFSSVLLILLVISLLSLNSLNHVKESVSVVVNKNQPLVIASLELSETLYEANGFLGFYLLSKEAIHKESYLAALKKINTSFETLKRLSQGEFKTTLARLGDNIAKLMTYKDRMLVLPTDSRLNFPAFDYASKNLNPFAQTNLQMLSEMILSEDEEEATEERKKLLNEIQEYRYAWLNLLNNVRIFLNQPVDTNYKNLTASLSQIPNLINKLELQNDLFTFEQEDDFPKLKETSLVYLKNTEKMIALHRSKKRRMDAYLIRAEIAPLMVKIEQNLGEIISGQRTAIQKNSTQLLSEVESGANQQLILLVIGLILGSIAAWLISNLIGKNLSVAVIAMREVAQGDGDLTKRLGVKGHDEIAQLSTAFNTFAQKVAVLVSEVADVSRQLLDASLEMNKLTNTTRDAMKVQINKVGDVSVSMQDIAQQVTEISQATEQAAEISQLTDTDASEGKMVVNESIRVVNQLKLDFKNAMNAVQVVETDAESIGSVLSVIQGIAEQTNLLALNAAIEAARAGEQGRGFAVVADEVRTLASRTQESTLEIKDIIERLQAGSSKAANVMSHGAEQVQISVDYTENVGNSLSKISKSVASMKQMNNQIATAAGEHVVVSDKVKQDVAGISHIASEAADDVELISVASEGVSQLTDKLQVLIKQFRY